MHCVGCTLCWMIMPNSSIKRTRTACIQTTKDTSAWQKHLCISYSHCRFSKYGCRMLVVGRKSVWLDSDFTTADMLPITESQNAKPYDNFLYPHLHIQCGKGTATHFDERRRTVL